MSNFEEVKLDYYSLKPVLSRGAVLSFVLGHRGAGKTYAFKEWALKDWLETGAEFVYVRRLDSEMAEIKLSLFDDVAHSFGMQVKSHGSQFKIRPSQPLDLDDKELREWNKDNPWKTFGYAMSLNKQQDYKSGAWPLVNKICYDEFIIENPSRHYLKDEPSQFINLLSTVLRNRKGRVVALSNAGAMWNPYFDYYGVSSKDLQQQFIKRNKGAVVFERYHSEANEKALKAGLMGQLGSEKYIEYAIESKFKDADEHLIIPIEEIELSHGVCNLVTGEEKKLVLCVTKGGKYYVKKGKDGSLDTYGLNSKSMTSSYSKEISASLRENFYRKTILFDSIDSRLAVMNSINY